MNHERAGEHGEQLPPPDAQPPAGTAGPAATASGRPRRRWLWVLAVLIVAAVGGITVLRPWTRPQPYTLLQEMVAAINNADTVQAHGTYLADITMGAIQQKVSMPFSVAFQAPNLLSIEQGEGLQHFKLVCDGHDMYFEVPVFGMVVKCPAVADVRDMDLSKVGGLASPDTQQGLLMLIPRHFDMDNVVEAAAGFDETNEWLASLNQPKGCLPVTVHIKQGPAVVLWIDTKTKHLRQAALQMGSSEILKQAGLDEMTKQLGGVGGASGARDETDEMMKQFIEAMKDIEIGICMTVDDLAIDQPVSPEAFAYRPTKDERVITAQSLDDLSDAIMTGMRGSFEETATRTSGTHNEHATLKGKKPPSFTAYNLKGKAVKITAFKGKPVVLDIWTTWCGPCRKELPILEEIYTKLKSKGLRVVAVSCDMSKDDVAAFLREHPVSFTVLWLDPTSTEGRRMSEAYKLTAIPRTLYIGRDWIIKEDTVGLHPKSAILEAIARLGIDVSAAR